MSSTQSLPGFNVLFDAIATDLREHGYSIQNKALPEEWIDGLLRDMHMLGADQLKLAGVGRAQQHVANANIRRDAISWIESTEGEQGQWLAFSAQLQQHLNRSLMLGLFSFESHFAHYAPGAFYKTHVDAFKGQANRVLSVVLYLNPVWGFGDGGEMVLYSDTDPGTVLCTVSPHAGTLVVFLSEDFPHEVLPALRDRYSIAGWYRVNTSNTGRVDPPA
ncbi:MAG: 2OG-Fe(II) oxygenase [Gammaproteobacteria bacterium]|uniref:2OG-Fe(II) oxygenase n=1 Tax=Limnobacter sp. TaxID=2003368 RepID=UPI001D4D3B3E|nr:2OG-Fe(II) oxygenase [Limnobacter sp.]MBU0782411.1 2OG-Fe(II) oxygenase [Gammaproteobacteria bacterium]MBU0849999.1 2OG-Fe(II) oxygenase [Gammaproteobacteria bacterium]MBU1268487.1 2OG-Fe(II) oxygenase [Gammaproteobacteria bacterium]MBU1528035.1 2OG-Fe(II) oxygenase [Gammaproteobacteria bacterium]MBU1781028.1 2OG-Fe(II) oxygenase [Gammaproteobacteria bacterium]